MNADDWSVITGISTGVIALCALGLSIWQGILTRTHNRLSFRPHLTTWTHSDAEKGFYAVELINNGIGPAVIEEFSVKVDGKLVSGDGAEVIGKVLKIVLPNLPFKAQQSYLAKGYSMAPKERCTIFAVQFLGQSLPSKEFAEQAINRGDLDISYKSFYNERFSFSTQEEKSKKPSQPT
jgi:hypothetical protein